MPKLDDFVEFGEALILVQDKSAQCEIFVALRQGLFAAVCAYFLMIAPCLIYKKRFADAATLTALTGLLMGYYANALLGVFGVLIQVPAYAITYRGDIKRAVRRFVNNR